MRCKHVASVLIIAFVAAGAAGQGAPAGRAYENAAEVAELDKLVGSAGQLSPAPEDLVELSRLLSSPCDQVVWLLGRAQAPQRDPATAQAAKALVDAALARGETLKAGSFLGDCGDALTDLHKLAEREVSPLELVEPAAISEWLKQQKDLTTLPAGERFTLLARGVSESRLFKASGSDEAWDKPRLIIGALARDPYLPPFGSLRNFQQQLNAGYEGWKSGGFQPLVEKPQQQAVLASFQIAAAVLDRALGWDAQDPAGAARVVDYPVDAAGFTRLAEELEAGKWHTWSVLARLLAVSSAGPVDGDALRKTWADVQAVSPDSWAAMSEPKDGWLVRVVAAGRRNVPEMLPLAIDFRAAMREKRRQFESQVLQLVKGVTNTADAVVADQIFRAVQSAKAAGLGLSADPEPLTLAQVKDLLGDKIDNDVYLFVEMIELREVETGGGRFCGVALYRPEYRENSLKGVAYTDHYVEKILRLSGSPNELVEAALARPEGPPADTAEARFLLALDGPPPANWFDFEQSRLLPLAQTSNGWIVYLPSAMALGHNWTKDDTQRVWYRLGVRGGSAVLNLEVAARDLATTCPLKSKPISGMLMACLRQGKSENVGADLTAFMNEKRSKKITALPVWVRK